MGALETIAKVGLYATLLTLVGTVAARWLLQTSGSTTTTEAVGPRRRLARIGLTAGALLLACLVFRLLTHTAAVFGSAEGPGADLADALSGEHLSIVAFSSRWGRGWRAQTTASIVSLLTSIWAVRRPGSWTLVAATVAAALLACTFPLVGHAAGAWAREALAVAHVLGAGLWLGTLTALVLTGHQGALWERFSRMAFAGATAVAVTGLTMAGLYLGTPANLLTTPYGQLLALKIGVAMAIGGCGYLNWRHARVGGQPPTARIETLLAAVIVVVTAFLTEMAHP